MIDFIRAMIKLYKQRYHSKLYFFVEKTKNCYPRDDEIEYFKVECPLCGDLTSSEYDTLHEFEKGYFFNPYLRKEENYRSMHLDLIRYYCLNLFNNFSEHKNIKHITWGYIPKQTPYYIERIVNLAEEDKNLQLVDPVKTKIGLNSDETEYTFL